MQVNVLTTTLKKTNESATKRFVPGGGSLAVRSVAVAEKWILKNSRRSCVAFTPRRKRGSGQRQPSALRKCRFSFGEPSTGQNKNEFHQSLKNDISELNDWIVLCLQSNQSLLCGLINVKFSTSQLCSLNCYQIKCTATFSWERRQTAGATLKNHISALNYRIGLNLNSN